VTTIDPTADLVTLINVFAVRPERQRALIDLLERATEEVMRDRPGFVSANLHRGLDGTSVANYAQWRSVADFEAMLADPAAAAHLREAAALAERFEPHLYAVAYAATARRP
jgi:quinol monooxygenase YgiN